MKTFINAAYMAVLALLFVASAAFGNCCKTTCAPKKSCAVGCKLQPAPVEIIEECNDAGEYKQVCHLEYIPCSGKTRVSKAYPRFIGCYDENGNPIDGRGSNYISGANNGVVHTQEAKVEVISPSYNNRNGKRMNKRMMKTDVMSVE